MAFRQRARPRVRTGMSMRLLICSPVAVARFDARLRAVDGLEVSWAEPAELSERAHTADALVLPGAFYTPELARTLHADASPCRWLQLLTAGYEQLVEHGVPSRIEVNNAGSVWSPIVAEHAMALLLTVARRIPRILDAQAHQHWDDSIRHNMSMLIGSRLVIVGMGSIGTELARRARAFGMAVTGVSRSGAPNAEADQMLPVGRLHEALAQADHVVVAVPLSADTRGLIGAAELAACRPHTVIVNVGRGPVIDSQALEQALAQDRIAGAALDVTDPEPLPAHAKLWRSPRVVISPHLGGAAPEAYNERLVAHVVANVQARLAGLPAQDRVRLAAS